MPGEFLICGGASRGGLDVAVGLARRGLHCTIAGRRAPEAGALDGLAAPPGFEQVDFADATSVADLCQRLRGRDIGNCVFFQRARGEDLLQGFQVAVLSAVDIVDALRDSLARHRGSVVFIGSIVGSKVHFNQTLSYHLSKGALKPLMQYLAVHLGPAGIRVNLLSLSTFEHARNAADYTEGTALYRLSQSLIPTRQPARSADLANLIEFLSRPESAAITGQDIHVDGGLGLLSQVTCALQYGETDDPGPNSPSPISGASR